LGDYFFVPIFFLGDYLLASIFFGADLFGRADSFRLLWLWMRPGFLGANFLGAEALSAEDPYVAAACEAK
jgi:hypothetical protein